MTDPNSSLTRFRRRLAACLDPGPDAGEAWCVNCTLNGGRSLVMPADSSVKHIEMHQRENPKAHIAIKTAWPCDFRSES